MSDYSLSSLETQGVEASTGAGNFKVLEPGDYNVMISNAVIKSNANKNGEGLQITFSVIDGNDAGAEFTQWINLKHATSEQAVKIGLSELMAIYKVSGSQGVPDLVGKSIRARLSKDPSSWTDRRTGEKKNGFNNSVKKYMNLEGIDAKGEKVEPFKAAPVSSNEQTQQSAQQNGSQQNQSGGSGEQLFDSAPDF